MDTLPVTVRGNTWPAMIDPVIVVLIEAGLTGFVKVVVNSHQKHR
jgi:hypothetical protein